MRYYYDERDPSAPKESGFEIFCPKLKEFNNSFIKTTPQYFD